MAIISRQAYQSREYNRPFFDSLVNVSSCLALEPTDEQSGSDSESLDVSPPNSSAKRKWTPTPEAFDKLMTALAPDRSQAGQEYEIIRIRLLRFFEWRGCTVGDSLTDEVFDRVMRRLDEGEVISNIRGYIYSVATFVLMEWSKQKEQTCLIDETSVVAVEEVAVQESESDDDDLRIRCFDECLAKLTDEDRETLIEYHTGEKREKIERRIKLAAKLNLSLNALRIRVHRIRKELEHAVKTCVDRGSSE